MSKRILIVEDERNLARFVSLELQHEGYDVVTADNGREGLEMALEKDFDLILLDLMLPEMDGFEVTRRLQQEKDTYIMMMTARDSIMDIVAGLDRGADDYIIKPFSIDELGARVAAHLRRDRRQRESAKVHFDDKLAIDYTERSLYYNGEQITLSKKEFGIIELLSQHIGQVFSKERIYELVWDYDSEGDSSVIAEHIRRIRSKFAKAKMKQYIETVWGVGYKWIR